MLYSTRKFFRTHQLAAGDIFSAFVETRREPEFYAFYIFWGVSKVARFESLTTLTLLKPRDYLGNTAELCIETAELGLIAVTKNPVVYVHNRMK